MKLVEVMLSFWLSVVLWKREVEWAVSLKAQVLLEEISTDRLRLAEIRSSLQF